MLKELYQELCRHRVTHDDDYAPIEKIICTTTAKYPRASLVKNDNAGLLFKIGAQKPNTMFISHMDMVNTAKAYTLRSDTIDIPVDTDLDFNELGICRNIAGENMGADDKAGIVVLLSLMSAGVEGYYLFTRGEESGGIGAKHFVNDEANKDLISTLQKVVSFDRRGTHSIITEQGGKRCCSDKFALHLAFILRSYGMFHVPDPTGSYTCSKEFIYSVPECTNISVGYMKEHSGNETLDFVYLQKLIDACCEIDWQGLPVFKEAEVKPAPVVYPPALSYDYPDYAGYYGGYERSVYWDAQLGKYVKTPTVQELFPEPKKISKSAIAKPLSSAKQRLIHAMELMESGNTLFVQLTEKIFATVLSVVAEWCGTKVKAIEGEVQYIILSRLKTEELLLNLKPLATAFDEKLECIDDNYSAEFKASPSPDYIIIASPFISDEAMTELEESESSNGGISPEQYGMTLEKPYAIYATAIFYYVY